MRGDPQLPEDFRVYLKDVYEQRRLRNPSYSLRAFAKSLDLSSSELSKIVRGKRRLTKGKFQSIARCLALDPSDVDHFAKAYESGSSKQIYRDVPSDSLASNWHHMAIVELIKTEGFVPNVEWIARRLGLVAEVVESSVAQLRKSGFIKDDGERWYVEAGSTTSVNEKDTSLARRELQRQVLSKALNALDDIPFSDRDQSSLVMAIDSSKLPEARRRIKAFRRELADFLENENTPDEVYYLSCSLFPVSKKNKQTEGVAKWPSS